MTDLKELINAKSYKQAWSGLYEQARVVTEYNAFMSLCRLRNRLARDSMPPDFGGNVKVALLGGSSTEMLEAPLILSLEALGIGCEIYCAEYNTFAQEMLSPDSETVAFDPDVSIIVSSHANLTQWPEHGTPLENVEKLVAEVSQYWLNLCFRLHENTNCEIILNNFHSLPVRPTGNLGAKLAWDGNSFLRRVNIALGDHAPAYVHINDVDWLSSSYGIENWFDARYWHHAKQPVSFECLVKYVRNTTQIIGAILGKSAKCLVLDLDNTLWAGVIGDDGLDGISVGEGDPVGEAFKAFQKYILELKKRGVLLAVCSKNDEANALEPFEKHPEMVLKKEDFVSFKANWASKPDNLVDIARELNLGLESLVFVDDSPAEREHVRQRLPDVKMIELTDDPADYPRLLDKSAYFETVALSDEDRQKTQHYQSNVIRKELRESSQDYASYLASLKQKAVIRPFETIYLDRITQLINKSNQYNLTTLRQNRSQVEALIKDPNIFSGYVRLADRFGDNGLICVFFARQKEEELWIEEWLMSCRVLKRGVECLLCNYVVKRAQELGIKNIHGIYMPTEKNGLVRDHYKKLGFTIGNLKNDSTYWHLDPKAYKPFDVAIELVGDY